MTIDFERQRSIRPYLIRAWYDWCVDHNWTPQIQIKVDGQCRVPADLSQHDEVIFNLSPEAIHGLQITDFLVFSARFGGVAHDISLPIGNVTAIFVRENGFGESFNYLPAATGAVFEIASSATDAIHKQVDESSRAAEREPTTPSAPITSHLKRIK